MKRAQRRKFHFIYKTTCLITNKYYYGMHSTDNLDDGYLGSGKHLRYSILKYGEENHICEKIEFFETREDLKKKESEIVNELLINDPLCMNLQLGGGGGFSNEIHRKKCTLSGITAQWNNLEFRKRHLIRCSKVLTEYNNTKNTHQGMKGKKVKEETKEKMRKTYELRKHQQKENNSQYGTCWITNNKETKKIHKGDLIPDGWRLGRTKK